MIPLGLLSAGENGEIVEIVFGKGEAGRAGSAEQDKSMVRVEEMGLRIGKNVEMLTNGGSTILLRVDEARIALARRMAMKIMVRR
ncbi:ferrous iron transport protein A [Geomonas sp. Red69]|uniref:Ferrous iron transport protein A n=1 Tax=Geomonas diazotrophica TaxID=2843197 RepID=A0ABX8JF06_9BACT|nr:MULTISPECIES: FeoA family protein [Geomonas]MBU5635818.1 ferrous iron transport protein A [Geomonas diazotrophica]QWV96983.1 ferrous iron transport protein A [Geomonas nitrogeniifigens]QXE86161.1 ferrous iron transport protein A [Geomonas nitrogeniifigens]